VRPAVVGEIVGFNVIPDPEQVMMSFGKLTIKLEGVKTGTMVSTTTQQVIGFETYTKSVSVLYVVVEFPIAPFDQAYDGLLMVETLAVMTEELQVEFWVKVTFALHGEMKLNWMGVG
jgi:hypothetical protein